MSQNEMISKIEQLREWETLLEEAQSEVEALRDNRYQHNGTIYETILDIKDIECLKVQGKILLLNLPDDAWNNSRYGEETFYILYEKDGQKFTVMKDYMAVTLRKLFITEN